MSDSPNLSLPLIQAAQAQKHITHNEALERLDALVQLTVEDLDATDPPADPGEGQIWGVGTGAADAWAGRDGTLAYFSGGGFLHLPVRDGMRAWNKATSSLFVRDAGQWRPMGGDLPETVPGLGINAVFDPENRLAVSSPATLLNHAGDGHQLKINKGATGDTASLLYQTGFSGRAEMGLAGEDDFSVKVSADGADWAQAFRVDGATGDTAFGNISATSVTGTAIQQSPEDTEPGRLMRADYGYGPGNILGAVSQSAGVPTGAVIERGETPNGRFTRFADGTQICVWDGLSFTLSGAIVGIETWTFPAPFVEEVDFVSVTLSLDAGDWSNPSVRTYVSAVGPQGSQTPQTARIMLYLSRAETTTIANCRVLAVGRWF